MRMYVQLDVDWPENPKRIRAGLECSAVHALSLCLAKRSKHDGWVDRVTLSLYEVTDDHIDHLVALGLLDKDGERIRPHDWLEVNLSSERIRAEKADKARLANHARWHEGPYEACGKCRALAEPETENPCSSEADPDGVVTESDRTETESVVIPQKQSQSDPEPHPQPEDPSLLDEIVEAVFVRVLADKERRGERIASAAGFRSWWDANELAGCRKRAAYFLEHYTMPTVGHYADATRSPSVPQWASPYLKREDPAA